MITTLQALKDLVTDLDVPHPTIPEYVELHEKMQTIIRAIEELQLHEAATQLATNNNISYAQALMHINNALGIPKHDWKGLV